MLIILFNTSSAVTASYLEDSCVRGSQLLLLFSLSSDSSMLMLCPPLSAGDVPVIVICDGKVRPAKFRNVSYFH